MAGDIEVGWPAGIHLKGRLHPGLRDGALQPGHLDDAEESGDAHVVHQRAAESDVGHVALEAQEDARPALEGVEPVADGRVMHRLAGRKGRPLDRLEAGVAAPEVAIVNGGAEVDARRTAVPGKVGELGAVNPVGAVAAAERAVAPVLFPDGIVRPADPMAPTIASQPPVEAVAVGRNAGKIGLKAVVERHPLHAHAVGGLDGARRGSCGARKAGGTADDDRQKDRRDVGRP